MALMLIVERFIRVLGWISAVLLMLMIGAMIYEVVSRYVFNAPNLWAFDVPWMLAGGCFLLAAGVTLQAEGHVRIDFLASMMPMRMQHFANLLFYVLIFLPALAAIIFYAVKLTWIAFDTDELETMSAWQPLIWPFYFAIALGFTSFWLQVVVSLVRHAMGMREPTSVDAPGQAPSF